MALEWSGDCVGCLSGMPHTHQAHTHAIGEAQEARYGTPQDLERDAGGEVPTNGISVSAHARGKQDNTQEVMVALGMFEYRVVHTTKKRPQVGWINYEGRRQKVFIGSWLDDFVWEVARGEDDPEYLYCAERTMPIEEDPDYEYPDGE